MLIIDSGKYRRLTLFPETEPDMHAVITLRNGQETVSKRAQNRQKLEFALAQNTAYEIEMDNALMGMMYLSSGDNEAEEGIRFLWDDPTPSLRFRAYQGYLGQVAGLYHYQNQYHMLYTWNPFGDTGSTLYMGHAVSRDLCAWVHQPVLLEPQGELQVSRYRTGGVLAGCAAVSEKGVRLYFTRGIGTTDSGEVVRQYQMQTESRDGFHFAPEAPLLPDLPSPFAGPAFCGISTLETAEGHFLMVGSTWKGMAALLLYQETEKEPLFLGPMLREKGATQWENGACFPVGRSYGVLGTFSMQGEKVTYWYIGSFRDGHLRVRNRGILDFGGDFSAPFAFRQENRTLLLGTIGRKGRESCISLPREVYTKGGKLYQSPAKEVYDLRGDILYAFSGGNQSVAYIDTPFYMELDAEGETEVAVTIEEKGEERLSFRYANGRCFFERNGEESIGAQVEKLEKLEVIVDTYGAEVFINGGEAAGTKGLYDMGETVKCTVSASKGIGMLKIFQMEKRAFPLREEPLARGETLEF